MLRKKMISVRMARSFSWLNGTPTIGCIISKTSPSYNLGAAVRLSAERYGIEVREGSFGTLATVTIGGDGTTISTARNMPDVTVPVIAVRGGTHNAAPLIHPWLLERTLDNFLLGRYRLESREMLIARLPVRAYKKDRYGYDVFKFDHTEPCIDLRIVNEIVVTAIGDSYLSINLKMNGTKLAHFNGNGILISTALGSTAENWAYHGKEISHGALESVTTPIAAGRSRDDRDKREFATQTVTLTDKPGVLVLEYLKKHFYVNLGVRINIDNMTPVFVPRRVKGTVLDPLEVELRRGDPWYLLMPDQIY